MNEQDITSSLSYHSFLWIFSYYVHFKRFVERATTVAAYSWNLCFILIMPSIHFKSLIQTQKCTLRWWTWYWNQQVQLRPPLTKFRRDSRVLALLNVEINNGSAKLYFKERSLGMMIFVGGQNEAWYAIQQCFKILHFIGYLKFSESYCSHIILLAVMDFYDTVKI